MQATKAALVMMLAGVFLSFGAAAADAPISRLPSVPEHPSDPTLAKMFDGIRARGGQPDSTCI